MIAKVVLVSLLYAISEGLPYGIPTYGAPVSAPIYEAKPQPYSVAFNVKDEYGTTLLRQEEGDELGNKRGTYGYIDAYGISRQVDYVADEKGFRAVVKTNEPGTENQNPADVEIISSAAPASYDRSPIASYSRPSLSPIYGQQAPVVYGPAPIVKQVPSAIGLGTVSAVGPIY